MRDTIYRDDAIDAVKCKTTFESEEAIMAAMTVIGEVMGNIVELPSADRPQDREQFGKTEQLNGRE